MCVCVCQCSQLQNIKLIHVLVRKGIYFRIFDSQGTSRRTREPSLQATQTLSLTRSAKACVHLWSWAVHLVWPTLVPQTLEPPLQQVPDPHASISFFTRRCSPTGTCFLTLFLHLPNFKPQVVSSGGWSLGHMPATQLQRRLGKQVFWLLPGSVSLCAWFQPTETDSG